LATMQGTFMTGAIIDFSGCGLSRHHHQIGHPCRNATHVIAGSRLSKLSVSNGAKRNSGEQRELSDT
jgi:hypothetical protein